MSIKNLKDFIAHIEASVGRKLNSLGLTRAEIVFKNGKHNLKHFGNSFDNLSEDFTKTNIVVYSIFGSQFFYNYFECEIVKKIEEQVVAAIAREDAFDNHVAPYVREVNIADFLKHTDSLFNFDADLNKLAYIMDCGARAVFCEDSGKVFLFENHDDEEIVEFFKVRETEAKLKDCLNEGNERTLIDFAIDNKFFPQDVERALSGKSEPVKIVKLNCGQTKEPEAGDRYYKASDVLDMVMGIQKGFVEMSNLSNAGGISFALGAVYGVVNGLSELDKYAGNFSNCSADKEEKILSSFPHIS